MSRSSLLPRPVLFNAALYAAIALVYSVAFFIIDRAGPDKYVFWKASTLRTAFSYVVICSWPILLFGGLILIAVRVGATVHRRRRHRRKKNHDSSKNSEQIPAEDGTSVRRSRSRPGAGDALDDDLSDFPDHRRDAVVPPSPTLSPSAVSSPSSTASPSPSPSRGVGAQDVHSDRASSKKKSKKKKVDPSLSTSRSVPTGFVSVTPAQKLYAGIGFAWVAVGLAATSASAALVFFGQRERLRRTISSLGLESGEKWKEWVIPICTGGLFMLLFVLLALSTLSKVILTIMAPPHKRESRSNELETEEVTHFERDVIMPGGEEYDLDEDVEQGVADGGISRGALDHDVLGMVGESTAGSSSGTWRQFTSERQLPYQPDDQTIDRMMRQLRDMGFTNPHQNIAALQASCFDLEKASDKLSNAQTPM